jgi:hypothetical protein
MPAPRRCGGPADDGENAPVARGGGTPTDRYDPPEVEHLFDARREAT